MSNTQSVGTSSIINYERYRAVGIESGVKTVDYATIDMDILLIRISHVKRVHMWLWVGIS